MSDQTTIIFAGGGTGGHLYPGIAVAEALRVAMPSAKPLFLCTTREIDRVILEPTGFEFVTQPIVPPVRTVSGLLKFWSKWRETKEQVRALLRERRPAAVLGLGGYAAGVAVELAARQGVPTAILNPDVIPGKANRYLMKHAASVCCQFSQTASYVAVEYRPKLAVTGCPIRDDIVAHPDRDAAVARLGLDPMLRTLVITGASLRAQTINQAVTTMLKGVTLNGWQVLHMAGRDHADSVRADYRELQAPWARVIDFTADMADVWAVADLAISRSGASSCAELTASGVPSILMPYPYHKDLHQRANAKVLADANAAVLVDDEKDRRKNAAKLKKVLEPLLYNADKRQEMSTAATALGRPDAAASVADNLRLLVASYLGR